MILNQKSEIVSGSPLVLYGLESEDQMIANYDRLKVIFPGKDVFVWRQSEAHGRRKLSEFEIGLAAQKDAPKSHPYQWLHIYQVCPPAPAKAHTDGLPLNPWIPMQNPVDQKVMGKSFEEFFELIECMGRVGAAASRCFIQGVDESEPTTGKSNRQWLTDEVADVYANLSLMVERFELDVPEIGKRRVMKEDRQRLWHDMPGFVQTPGKTPVLPPDRHEVFKGYRLAIDDLRKLADNSPAFLAGSYKGCADLLQSKLGFREKVGYLSPDTALYAGEDVMGDGYSGIPGLEKGTTAEGHLFYRGRLGEPYIPLLKMPFFEQPPLIASWGNHGDPSRRDTLTVPQMLDQLSHEEIFAALGVDCTSPSTEDDREAQLFTTRNGWTWYRAALQQALLIYKQPFIVENRIPGNYARILGWDY